MPTDILRLSIEFVDENSYNRLIYGDCIGSTDGHHSIMTVNPEEIELCAGQS